MKRVRLFLFLLLTLALCVTLSAQESSDKKSMKKDMGKSQMMMPMPKPSPEMEKMMKMLVGSWSTSETFEVSEMAPKGGSGHGTAVIKRGPGGLSMVEDYNSHGAMGAFHGHGVFWWDDSAKGYKSVWCDNTTPNGCAAATGLGKWDGDNLVFDDEQTMMGKKYTTKTSLTSSGPSTVSMTMDSAEEGGSMKRMMSIKYTKAGGKGDAMSPGEMPKQ